MSFQAVRAVFEQPIIDAMAALDDPVPVYMANQQFPYGETAEEYATVDIQWGETTMVALGENLERLQGSLVFEGFTLKGAGPGRAQEIVTPVMRALNNLRTCYGYEATGAVGWCGAMTGPTFAALDSTPFFMVRLSVAISAKFTDDTRRLTTRTLRLTNPLRSVRSATALTKDVELVTPVAGLRTQEDANKHIVERLEKLEAGGGGSGGTDPDVLTRLDELESTHDSNKGHKSDPY